MSSMTLTKEALGIGGEFTSVLKALDLETIKSYIVDAPDYDNLEGLAFPGVSKLEPEYRIHCEQTGEVARAARGFSLFATGGVSDDGMVTSPDGKLHFVEDGVCYEKSITKQPDSFSTGFATIERIVPCKGHKAYKNVGTQDEPKFKLTGGEYTRCLHQWALMFAAGYYITFSIKAHHDRVIFEIANRVGNEQAREVAKAQQDDWAETRQVNFEERKAYAQSGTHVRNSMGLPADARLPDVPEVLEYRLPDGRTMREAILDLKGSIFVVEFTVPVNGEVSTQEVKATSINEIRSRMAPAYALAKTFGGQIKISAVRAA